MPMELGMVNFGLMSMVLLVGMMSQRVLKRSSMLNLRVERLRVVSLWVHCAWRLYLRM